MSLLLFLVMLFHFLVVCFVILTPFIGNNYLLILHVISIPFVVLHWIMNDNTCILTIIEGEIRRNLYGKPMEKHESFIRKFIDPIYDFSFTNSQYQLIIYTSTILLWLLSVYKLYNRWKNNSKSFEDFIIE